MVYWKSGCKYKGQQQNRSFPTSRAANDDDVADNGDVANVQ